MRTARIARPRRHRLPKRREVLEYFHMVVRSGNPKQRRLHGTARQPDYAAEILVAHLACEDDFETKVIAEERERLLQIGHRKTRVMSANNCRHDQRLRTS